MKNPNKHLPKIEKNEDDRRDRGKPPALRAGEREMKASRKKSTLLSRNLIPITRVFLEEGKSKEAVTDVSRIAL